MSPHTYTCGIALIEYIDFSTAAFCTSDVGAAHSCSTTPAISLTGFSIEPESCKEQERQERRRGASEEAKSDVHSDAHIMTHTHAHAHTRTETFISTTYHVFRDHVSDVHSGRGACSHSELLTPSSREPRRLGVAATLQPGPAGHHCPLQACRFLLTPKTLPLTDGRNHLNRLLSPPITGVSPLSARASQASAQLLTVSHTASMLSSMTRATVLVEFGLTSTRRAVSSSTVWSIVSTPA